MYPGPTTPTRTRSLYGWKRSGRRWTDGRSGECARVGTGHPADAGLLAGDLLLEAEDAVQQGLRPGRAAGHVDVDRDDLVDALGDRVRVPVGSAAVAAGAEADDVLRFGHLVVEPLDGRRHLVGDCAGHHHQVGLA